MAMSHGDRTEKPTGKRLKDARERGQIARSRDLSAAVSLACATLALGWFGAWIGSAISRRLALGLSTLADHASGAPDPVGLAGLVWSDLGLVAMVAGPPALAAGLLSAATSTAQTGAAWSPQALHVDWT